MAQSIAEQRVILLLLTMTVICMFAFPALDPFVKIFWSAFSLFMFISIFSASGQKHIISGTSNQQRHVRGILAGLHTKQETQGKPGDRHSYFRSPLVILALACFAYGVYLVNDMGLASLGLLSYIFLCGLIFWIVQCFSRDVQFATNALCVFSVLFLFQLFFVIDRPSYISLSHIDTEQLIGALILGCSGLFIFVKGLLLRHRNKEFPFIGALVLLSTLALMPVLSPPLFVCISVVLGATFAQSFPRRSPRHELRKMNLQLYLDKKFKGLTPNNFV